MSSHTIRLFFDARTIRPGLTGVGEYTLNLLRGLSEIGVTIRALILPESIEALGLDRQLSAVEWLPFSTDYQSHPAGDLALRFQIPKMVRPGEIYHGPAFSIPAGRQKFPRVVTIHDMGAFVQPREYPPAFAKYMRWVIRRSVKSADRVITPSEAVAREVAETLNTAPPRIRAVPEAAVVLASGEAAKPLAAGFAEHTGESVKFLISLGTLERRKDPLVVLRALERLESALGPDATPDWIWIGGEGYGAEEILAEIRASPAVGRFHHFGYAPRAAIQEAFEHAAALVFPSRYEGFGLPTLEAMAAGLPVVVSDLPVTREVCAEAALYFKPGDVAGLVHALTRLLTKPGVTEDLRTKGFARSREFTWRRAAEMTAQVYEELLSEKSAAK